MGAWSEGIYSNDKALDMEFLFNKKVTEGFSVNEAISALWNDEFGNEGYLLLADKEYEANKTIHPSRYEQLGIVIREELQKRTLSNWRTPSKRRKVLVAFCEKIGYPVPQ